ncbi:helix-turn-helix domain-containing protein [Marinifilum flexuosum]|uniref:helix-turn-helix domain-containing protein n=1 Tax=Marinifilum flexuosum TaxID=1117708 RepID=UPI002490CD95|nr:AraC family transcriptional regulator [Marinifilum flexuosum]
MRKREKRDPNKLIQMEQGKCEFYIGKLEEVEHASVGECRKKFREKDLYGLVFQFGGAGVHHVDCKRHELTGNVVTFLSPGQVHSFDFQKSRGYLLEFSSNIFHQSDDNRKLYDYPFFHTTLNSVIMELPNDFSCLTFHLESIYKEYQQTCFKKQNHLKASLELLLIDLERLYRNEVDKGVTQTCDISGRIRKLETLIDEYYKENRSVAFYADKLHLSSRHLNNIIKESGCNSVSDLIQKRVLLEAKRLLLHSDFTVTEISAQLNFSDKAYFHRYFKTQTGRTPEQFRKEFLKVH